MSAKPEPVITPTTLPDRTEVDGEALFASVVWFHTQKDAGNLDRYQGMHLAILGEQILDVDRNVRELVHRLEARGDTIPGNRVVIKYIPGVEDIGY